jgi:hypothetical protein
MRKSIILVTSILTAWTKVYVYDKNWVHVNTSLINISLLLSQKFFFSEMIYLALYEEWITSSCLLPALFI